LLAALNAASYVRVEREPELEASPDRSTSNAGATGTRAVYEYLEATDHKVMRWRDPVESLLKGGKAGPSTFVVVGTVRLHFSEEERKSLLRWVARGGRLVVIDRLPELTLKTGERWGVSSTPVVGAGSVARADDVEALLAGTKPVAPTQPTLVAAGVERVAPSRLATRLRAAGRDEANDAESSESASDSEAGTPAPSQSPPRDGGRDQADEGETNSEPETDEPPPSAPTPRRTAAPRPSAPPRIVVDPTREGGGGAGRAEDYAEPDAPVFNFADERGALVAEFTRGRGRVVVLADPFIVANNGISRADNLQLATNVIAGGGNGLIAFDEYHQGRGETHNQLATYFAGTPVIAMFAQAVLIAAVVVWSRGRRFARPLPAPRPDRRSKLEFVASMAELQQRARAFDLALENIYSRTRRALARYGGTDLAAAPEEIAAAVAARSGTDRARLETLLRECEDATKGQPVSARRALHLAAALRELESSLGIRMREREIKQASNRLA
jgi:hypothetical protein